MTRNYAANHTKKRLCRACPLPLVGRSNCWCEFHWFQQAAHRSGLPAGAEWIERLRTKLIAQDYKCAYTGKTLVVGLNASVDHKNPSARFPDQRDALKNLEWVDVEVNRAKRCLTKEEFIDLCIIVADRHRHK